MSLGVFIKRPTEKRKYAFDFAHQAEIQDGEDLNGVPTVVATPSGLTISSIAVVGDTVAFFIESGTAGTDYEVTCTVTTSGGATLVECGTIRVLAC